MSSVYFNGVKIMEDDFHIGMPKKKKSNRYEDRPYFETELIECKKKNNRVLNENLDKVKFPFYCTFETRGVFTRAIETRIGEVHRGVEYYSLFDITEQTKDRTLVRNAINLDELIRKYNINIVKGKLLLFKK